LLHCQKSIGASIARAAAASTSALLLLLHRNCLSALKPVKRYPSPYILYALPGMHCCNCAAAAAAASVNANNT
jgi:hypothetical protein